MKIGLLGTGAISHMHARAYKNLGWPVVACSDINPAAGQKFAQTYGCEFVPDLESLAKHPEVEVLDACTFPDVRLQPVEAAARYGKHVQVQKPMAVDLATARKMMDTAKAAGIVLNVVSQKRFDDSTIFVKKAIAGGRLGKILQADAYVKWFRSTEYYSRPIKGSWSVEGGGALINQAIHQVDILLWLNGPVQRLRGFWQLAALHKIESEDVVSAVLQFANGATGVVQAATAFWPGYSERVEIHGTKGTCVLTGDRLTTWDVQNDAGEPPPIATTVLSGASDPMAIPLTPFERQFTDFANAIAGKSEPQVSGEQAYRALELVLSVYQSCREDRTVTLGGGGSPVNA